MIMDSETTTLLDDIDGLPERNNLINKDKEGDGDGNRFTDEVVDGEGYERHKKIYKIAISLI